MRQTTERVFELHWRQFTQQRWQAVLTDSETELRYLVTSKLAFRTVLANLAAACRTDPAEQPARLPAEDAEAPE